ncbi:MAG TPA: SDR family NAD(P)-dependent oxidoreductase [Polyangiaceae bacterium]|nr:SDR family NAD(P)-dependent oxidoreductase [Polyangiaceae bacterium]
MVQNAESTKGCVIIFGAGSGTGAEIAKLFASHGHPVVVSRRDASALGALVKTIDAAKGRALGAAADATNAAQVTGVFETALATYGVPEVVVFNAAGFARASIVETAPDAFETLWRATAFGGFVVGREAAKHMLPVGKGTILFTGATAAVKASANFGAFASGKHGLRAVAQSMAKEFAPQGVHVAHVIIDGIIDVPRVREQMPELVAQKGEAGLINPRSIAETFYWLHSQPRDAWTFELDLRPFREPW